MNHYHWIDDHKTADLIDFDDDRRALEGVLAVQLHVGPKMTNECKDFKIKHLPDDLPLLKPEDHPIPAKDRTRDRTRNGEDAANDEHERPVHNTTLQ